MTTVNVPQDTNIQTFPHAGITPVDPIDQLDIETSTIKGQGKTIRMNHKIKIQK